LFVMLARHKTALSGTNNASPTSSYTWWTETLRAYAENKSVYNCPGQKTANGIGINHIELAVWGTGLVRVQEVLNPSRTVVFSDVNSSTYIVTNLHTTNSSGNVNTNQTNGPGQIFLRTPHTCVALCTGGSPAERHSKRLNTTFVDGHGEAMRATDIGLQFANGHAQALWDKK
jgi:prepilin-type processing-associated H-X9-DG protein